MSMSDDFRPREHDHLVEPMYEALREETQGNGGGASRGGRWLRVVVALLVVGAAGWAISMVLRGWG